MSKSVNKVILVGHIGGKPEIRATQEGKKIASFSLATSESWRDRETGEKQESTDWHKVVIYNQALIGIAEKYITKGAKVYVMGGVHYRKWLDGDGQARGATEIALTNYESELIVLSGKAKQEEQTPDDESSEAAA